MLEGVKGQKWEEMDVCGERGSPGERGRRKRTPGSAVGVINSQRTAAP